VSGITLLSVSTKFTFESDWPDTPNQDLGRAVARHFENLREVGWVLRGMPERQKNSPSC